METDRPTWRSRAWLVAVAVLAMLALVLMTVGVDNPVSVWGALAVSAGVTALVIAWALARTRSERRHYEEELASWAAEQATQAERLRIARDLHDLASHGLGLITVRAAAARTLTGPDGEAERANALADIERASRQTTTELRRMLALLRTAGPAPLRPADTLDDLPAIVKAANDAGLTVTLGDEEVGDVTAGVQLTVCAVVREALNNTIRHAGPSHARVGIHREADTIIVEVQDAGPRPGWQPQPGAGHGLDGLRERVAALDGSLHAEQADDGWLLTARIPDRGAT
ncbi:sensor histidine kinase [Micromonospora sp. NPDC048063]|uniref:sensor histidine kinase n=1 Tax=Micromonospora sp. NPDC048063 TaxID=3364256 RepID=UPI00371FB36F